MEEGGVLVGPTSRALVGPPAWADRAEIDTSAPFESVKEAVDRFGGSGHWKSQLRSILDAPAQQVRYVEEEIDAVNVEKQAALLEKELIAKEKETLDVLKELEMTKKLVDGLKQKLQEETSEIPGTIKRPGPISDSAKVHPIVEQERNNVENNVDGGPSSAVKQSPGVILMELKQAKLNLNRTTDDLAGIRAYIDHLNKKIAKEKALLEKTREKLSSNTAKVSSLEEDLSRTTMKLQEIRKAESFQNLDPADVSRQIKELSSEMDKYKRAAEAAKSEVLKLTAEIEQLYASTKTAKIRCTAAKKMEEAARASEAIALAEVKALTESNSFVLDAEDGSGIVLPMEEYLILTSKAQEAEERSMIKIEAAISEIEEASKFKEELLIKVEEAKAEIKTSRKALEEALVRVKAANNGKLAVEEALRRWRSENGQKRRPVHCSTKFKNSSYPTNQRRDSRILDMNAVSAVTDELREVSSPLSIGQILSLKLSSPEQYETAVRKKLSEKPKVSLGQMLGKKNGFLSPKRTEDGSGLKRFSGKRKKFGLAGLSIILARQDKKKNKRSRHTRSVK